MKLLYYCALAQQNGYARAAEDYCMALHRAGVDIAVRPLFDCDLDNLEDGYEELRELAVRKMDEPTHVIIHAMPETAIRFAENTGILKGVDHRICVTTWETDAMPEHLQGGLEDEFTQVVVPSRSCVAAVGCNAARIPHCFNEELWKPKDVERDSEYVFYTIGSHTARKNIEGLLKVYLTRFTGLDNVNLVIVAPQGDEVEALIERIKAGAGDLDFPSVDIVSDRMSNEDLRGVHAHCDCYVSLSRGEGWNLGAFEAALMGNLVIATEFGGHLDFLDFANSSIVPCSFTPAISMPTVKTMGIGGMNIPMSATTRVASGVDGRQSWAEPALIIAGHTMVVGAKSGSLDPSKLSCDEREFVYASFVERYGYLAIGKQFKDFLEAL